MPNLKDTYSQVPKSWLHGQIGSIMVIGTLPVDILADLKKEFEEKYGRDK
jgi:hypothetical protein